MQLSLNEVIEAIHRLPNNEQEKVRQILENERREKETKNAKSQERLERYRRAKEWLAKHSDEYMNQWVCLYGDKLIAHGVDGLEVHRKAKEAGIESPFLHHIVDESMLFGGW